MLTLKDVAEAIVNFKEKSWQEFYDENLKRLKAYPDHTWYPQEWLSFLLAGYPAGKMMLSTLSSGKGKKECVCYDNLIYTSPS